MNGKKNQLIYKEKNIICRKINLKAPINKKDNKESVLHFCI